MNFAIYQFQLSAEAREHLNQVGSWITAAEEYPEIEIRRDVYNGGGSEGFKSWMSDFYKAAIVVMNVNQEDIDAALEQVFHEGNGYAIVPEVHIIREAHSVSVGDIIGCIDTGRYYMVDPVGFTEIEFTPKWLTENEKEVA